MKALLKEFAPTAVFAVIVICMLGMTLRGVNELHRTNGVEHATLVGQLGTIQYRLKRVESTVDTLSEERRVAYYEIEHVSE